MPCRHTQREGFTFARFAQAMAHRPAAGTDGARRRHTRPAPPARSRAINAPDPVFEVLPRDLSAYRAGNIGIEYVHRFESGRPGPART